MAELPRLSDFEMRILANQREDRLAGAKLLDGEQEAHLRATVEEGFGPGSSMGVDERTRCADAILGTLAYASARFNDLVTMYFGHWSASATFEAIAGGIVQSSTFSEWLDLLTAKVLEEVASMWAGSSSVRVNFIIEPVVCWNYCRQHVEQLLSRDLQRYAREARETELKALRRATTEEGSSQLAKAYVDTAQTGQKRLSYRTNIKHWMKSAGLESVAAAAKRLGVGESTLKSIMTDKGEKRYSEETLNKVLEKIRKPAS